MANVFNITNTAGTLSFTLKPGQLDGPGGSQRNSDLRLYGMGALLWGEGVDTNIYRLTENFACPDKGELGSPVTVTRVPQDEVDLGQVGRGITNPVNGQQWFNTTDGLLYVYNAALGEWKPTGGSLPAQSNAPANPELGQLWYDTVITNPEVSECLEALVKVYDPTHPQADGLGWVALGSDRLSRCGGTMEGDINMAYGTGSPPTYTYFTVTGLADPVDPRDAVNLQYLDAELDAINGPGGTLSLHIADNDIHLSSNQNILLDQLEAAGCLNGTTNSARIAQDLCDLFGYSNNTGDIYTDINSRMPKAGGTFTGNVTLNGPGHQNTGGLAATEAYVNAQVSAVADIGDAARVVRYFNNPSAFTSPGTYGVLDGDIYSTGSTIYVYASGAWRQIFPAVYS